ncbi:nucleotide-binding universal stress UspA family protein [Granulicella aggregans]|uniref:Nucleotide-binding universal stress UspA family protein n=1 Tax=Granulicella aggregans TaxID=474949 RepID=A0A7W7ZAG3_9BACT|nr:universal stress protein [Granulicella aggregans]MBB5056319.1 nucleotide-binding universal stress UspA family protein [Granulicella aggregans]
MPLLQGPTVLTIDRILLATDFSQASEKAAAYAVGIARRYNSSLEIANVFDPSVTASYEEAILPSMAGERKKISTDNLQNFASQMPLDGIRTSIVATEGHRPADVLLEIAGEHQADLIVAGTEAKSGLARLILGSTAEKILRGAVCPVLTVGPLARTPKAGPLVFKTILYATDFSPEAAKAAAIALSFAQENAAHLFCCCVLNPNDEGFKTRDELQEGFLRRLKDSIPESAFDWCTPECVVEYGEAADRLLSLTQRMDADLIVLGARHSSFWLTRVEGGLTAALLAGANCPVLTIC